MYELCVDLNWEIFWSEIEDSGMTSTEWWLDSLFLLQ